MVNRLRAIWSTVRDAADIWSSRNAFQAAGALAFYTLFSLAPLLIIVISLAGAVFGEEAVRGEVAVQLSGLVGPEAAEFVQDAVRRSRIEQSGWWPTVLGVGAVLFGATTVFAQMRSSLNAFWDVRSRPSRNDALEFLLTRLVSFGMVLVIGFLLLTSFLLSVVIAGVLRFADDLIPVPALVVSSIDYAVSFVVVTALFAAMFRVLPDVRLAWRDVARGAALTGVLFVIGQHVISLYLTRATVASAYGAAGSLVVVLLWVYYSALILLFGAAVTRALVRQQGRAAAPARGAVRVRTEVVQDG
jgi:membrane protein